MILEWNPWSINSWVCHSIGKECPNHGTEEIRLQSCIWVHLVIFQSKRDLILRHNLHAKRDWWTRSNQRCGKHLLINHTRDQIDSPHYPPMKTKSWHSRWSLPFLWSILHCRSKSAHSRCIQFFRIISQSFSTILFSKWAKWKNS